MCSRIMFAINYEIYFSESHFWPFTEIDGEGKAYKDVLSDYDFSAMFYTSPIEPGKVLTFSTDKYVQIGDSLRDDCLCDPELCFKTGLTIGLWLKRRGNSLSSGLILFSGIRLVYYCKCCNLIGSVL